MKAKNLFFKVMRWVLVVAVIGFLSYQIYLLATQISLHSLISSVDIYLLGSSLALTFVALMVSGIIWHYLLRSCGADISFRDSLGSFIFSHLGRYIPGKIWTILGRVVLTSQQGVPKSVSAQCAAIEVMIGIVSGISLSMLVLPSIEGFEGYTIGVFSLVAIALIIFLQPKIFGGSLNFGLRLFGRDPIEITYRFQHLLWALAMHISAWLIFGTGFYLLVLSIDPASTLTPLYATGAFAGAWVVGYLSFLTPAGIGVREAALIGVLLLWMPQEIAILSAIASRLLTVIADFLAVLLATSISKVGKS
jgi:uncharacterized membrane protein YbhN (UPF0104 family)